MKLDLSPDWKSHLKEEFKKTYFKELLDFIALEYQNSICYPPLDSIFAAFEHCSFDQCKVVIIGQDPYHGPNQANGLCFSVAEGTSHPPSLINIFKELASDVDKTYPLSGNLEHWAKQGVLLLNATLTVRESKAGSHQKMGWETFTDQVIKTISKDKSDVVFMLWGGYAKEKVKLIDTKKHHVLVSGHPSPLSANRGYWFGNKHFSRCNEILTSLQLDPIYW
ncbi:uracil-DNA glycosylase [Galbibacter marinus]|uniref:Uracil-DNA glycosylase n=1 Tax=Galbibacter marinus TaxID=555500 RepID=K2QJF0_9FLAO|nr:uracil-DNA glycosylase [Galbibacter marinus]EKF54787.1 uracil-DNA glycosylase [Galbibacter marinus]